MGALTMKTLFSWAVWKRPCPNLEVVSMNLSSIFSRARRLWCTRRDWGSVGKESLKTEVPTPSSHPQSTHPSPVRTPFFLLSPSTAPLLNRLEDRAGQPPTPRKAHGAPAPRAPPPAALPLSPLPLPTDCLP